MIPSGPFDVVVIGAGPAGSSAAIAAARAGGRVLLAERSCFPRTKVCGCCLGPAGVAALGRLGAATALEEVDADRRQIARQLRLEIGGCRFDLLLRGLDERQTGQASME